MQYARMYERVLVCACVCVSVCNMKGHELDERTDEDRPNNKIHTKSMKTLVK